VPLTERDRKTIKIGGIVAGSMIVLVLLLSLLGRDDTDTIALPSVSAPTDQPTTGTGGPTTGTSGPTTAPTTPSQTPTAVFTGRDPFSLPAVFQTTTSTTSSGTDSTSSGTDSTSSGTDTTSTSTGTDTTSTSTSTSSSSSPTQPGNGAATTVGGHDVVLLDTFTVNGVDTVQVEVDGTVYDVAEGDTFGPGNSFELLSVSEDCAAFLFGDESFTLCANPQK
jgi:hypothetical protein